MDLHIDIEPLGPVLLVTASGKIALDTALQLLKQAFDVAKEKELNKILVNTLAVEGELSTFERYRLAIGSVAHLRQRQMNPRVAFVGKPPTTNGFGVRVAQNRDVTTQVFDSQQAALEWLDKWPS
jgi:hypothetical protein